MPYPFLSSAPWRVLSRKAGANRKRRLLSAASAFLLVMVPGPVGRPAEGAEPSPAYRESLRRTLELRRMRRRAGTPATGAIAAYPMPPALVIRQRRGTHNEVAAFLNLLRYGGR